MRSTTNDAECDLTSQYEVLQRAHNTQTETETIYEYTCKCAYDAMQISCSIIGNK